MFIRDLKSCSFPLFDWFLILKIRLFVIKNPENVQQCEIFDILVLTKQGISSW